LAVRCPGKRVCGGAKFGRHVAVAKTALITHHKAKNWRCPDTMDTNGSSPMAKTDRRADRRTDRQTHFRSKDRAYA